MFKVTISLLAAVVCANASLTTAGEIQPFLALVVQPDAPVRCGPGEHYYATALAKEESRVTVYRRDADGWLAIRPPKGSFGFVAAKHVTLQTENTLARVTGRRAVAWIGSTVENLPDLRWQIELQPDEVVEVSAQAEMSPRADAEPELFCRITPPSGEFRWIHENNVRPLKPQPTLQLADFQVVIPPDAIEADVPPREISARTSARTADRSSRSPPTYTLDEISVELSRMASTSPDTWDLEPLRRAAESLAENAESAGERSRLNRLLNRIEQFDLLQQRFSNLNRTSTPWAAADSTVTGDSTATGDPLANRQVESSPPGLASLYDGSGRLVRVRAANGTKVPPFALLDQAGEVAQYLTPAPGLNLNSFVNKQIGVHGRRGYVPALKSPHLTVRRVIDLERYLR